jgi:hypothetical protein
MPVEIVGTLLVDDEDDESSEEEVDDEEYEEKYEYAVCEDELDVVREKQCFKNDDDDNNDDNDDDDDDEIEFFGANQNSLITNKQFKHFRQRKRTAVEQSQTLATTTSSEVVPIVSGMY